MRNISRSDAFFEGLSPVKVGEGLDCKLWLSSFESLKLKTVVRRQQAEAGFGVEFIGLPASDSDRIMQYCGDPARPPM